MDSSEPHTASESGIRITLTGLGVNVLLLVSKIAVGLLTGSVSLVADGIHSASDMATDLTVIGGIRLGGRQADSRHPYGHGRLETLSGGIVAGVLIAVGLYITWSAGSALYRNIESFPGIPVIAVAVVSIVVKEWMYRRTVRVAVAAGSPALHANAWHHRSDALSSLAVLIGGAVSLAGWGHADQVAGIIVGLMVAMAGGQTLFGVFHELVEGGLSDTELDGIRVAIRGVPGVIGCHELRSRTVGRERFVDLHLLVDESLSLKEAHRISMDVEAAVQAAFSVPMNLTVHVEPDADELADHHGASTT